MDIHRKKHDTSDSFSFASSTEQEQEFEFGSITPDKNSPADHLFFNGRLLPHQFPVPVPIQHAAVTYSNARSSSSSSKDSLVSSRSNSSNSRSSTSSARTSCSDDRANYNKPLYRSSSRRADAAAARVYGSSQRWQFMAAPALSRDSSRRNRKPAQVVVGCNKQGKGGGRPRRFGWRILGWLMMACREFHAMDPINRTD